MRRLMDACLICSALLVLNHHPTHAQELDKVRRLTSIIVVSPMVGKGTYDDPRRPAVIRARLGEGAEARIGYRYLISDDGRSAIVEISGLDNAGRAAIKASPDQASEVFERDKSTKEDVETVLKRVKKEFRWEDFAGVTVPAEVRK